MRAFALVLGLTILLPRAAMAQDQNENRIQFVDADCDLLCPDDLGGYIFSGKNGSAFVRRVSPTCDLSVDDALQELTGQIEQLTKQLRDKRYDPVLTECLATLYADRGIVWRFKLGLAAENAPTKSSSMPTPIDNDIKDFTESLRLDPVRAHVYVHRGVSWLRKKKVEQATEEFDRA